MSDNLDIIYKNNNIESLCYNSYLPEAKLADFIKKKLKADSTYTLLPEEELEIASLNFHPEYQNSNGGWGSYYGPQWVLPVDGKMTEYPSIQKINKESFSYWESRLTKNLHPLLLARFSDLIIEFSQRILGQKTKISVYEIHIDAVIQLLRDNKINALDLIRLGKRAYHHCIATSNKEKAKEIITLMIHLENDTFDINKPGLWGFTLETFFTENSKKSLMTKEQVSSRVHKLENILENTSEINPIDAATYHLINYYSTIKDEVNLIRIIKKLESTYRDDMRMNSEPLLQIHYLEKLRDLYTQFESQFSSARKEARRILNEISSLDLDWEKSMKSISSEFTIDTKKIRVSLNPIFNVKDSENNLAVIIANLAMTFIPKEGDLREQLEQRVKTNPIQYLISTQIIATDGTQLAKLSNFKNDYEHYFKKFVSEQLTFGSIVLSIAIEELTKKYNPDEITKFLCSRLLFQDIEETLNSGLKHYFNGNYLEFCYLIIPCIENAIRKLSKMCGRTILKPNQYINGGFQRKLLSELLRDDELFESIYGNLSSNVQFYFKLVLTEQLGMNLRNDFAHGFEPKKFKKKNTADRLLHLLFCLAIIAKNE